MTAATVEAVYATALLELASEQGSASQVVADCAVVAEALGTVPELAALVDSPRLSREQTQALLAACFSGRVRDEVLNLLRLLVDRSRFADAPGILAEVQRLADDSAGRVAVSVTSAVDLAATERQRLQASLQQKLGGDVTVSYAVDAAIVGGLVLRVGDTIVDSSARRHLVEMKRRILDAPLTAVWEDDAASSEGESA